jgi:hypothetical protein
MLEMKVNGRERSSWCLNRLWMVDLTMVFFCWAVVVLVVMEVGHFWKDVFSGVAGPSLSF